MSDPLPDPSHSLDLARNLTALRAADKWSMRALTDRAHISERTLQYLEKSRLNPSLSTVDKLERLMLTQEQSSKHSGVNRGVIAHIERRARNTSIQTLARLAASLDMSIEALLSK